MWNWTFSMESRLILKLKIQVAGHINDVLNFWPLEVMGCLIFQECEGLTWVIAARKGYAM